MSLIKTKDSQEYKKDIHTKKKTNIANRVLKTKDH